MTINYPSVAFIDTTPGANPDCPFCPPRGFKGNPESYSALCFDRYSNDRASSQYMAVAAIHAARPESQVSERTKVVGPYANSVLKILASLKRSSSIAS